MQNIEFNPYLLLEFEKIRKKSFRWAVEHYGSDYVRKIIDNMLVFNRYFKNRRCDMEMSREKILGILQIVSGYLLPLAEQGARATRTDIDNAIVELFKGGLPAVEKYLRENEGN